MLIYMVNSLFVYRCVIGCSCFSVCVANSFNPVKQTPFSIIAKTNLSMQN